MRFLAFARIDPVCKGLGDLTMILTKFGHACVRLDKGVHSVVIDPGIMSPERGILDDVDTILITHEHFDHFVATRLTAAVAERPSLLIYTCPGVARHLQALSDHVRVVTDGQTFSVPGFEVTVVGQKHHPSHPDVPPVDNVGFLVDGTVFHPGDALTINDAPILLVPGQAPWMTAPDLIAYFRAIHPQRAYAIHEGLLNDWGLKVLDSVLRNEADRMGTEVRRLAIGESVYV